MPLKQAEAFEPAEGIKIALGYPLDPKSDRVFLKDRRASPTEEVDCEFPSQLSGGAIEFDIPIDRYVGPVDSFESRLIYVKEMIDREFLGKTATLIIAAKDVDNPEFDFATTDDPPPPPPPNDVVGPEIDRVFINGFSGGPLGGWVLEGEHGQYSLNAFEVPIGKLKFPEKGSAQADLQPAMNRVKIVVDEFWTTQDCWCVEIQWAALVIQTVSPIVLVHGNSSDPGFFDRQGFAGRLQEWRWPFDGCADELHGCRNPIELPVAEIASNGEELADQIPMVATSMGVDSIHLVVHSKGGLDARDYLARHQSGLDDKFKVLSFTSLSSPHNGSVAADYKVAVEEMGWHSLAIEGVGTASALITDLLEFNVGHPELTTNFVAGFNSHNVAGLPRETMFQMVAADADQDLVTPKRIDRLEEVMEWRSEWENFDLLATASPALAAYLADLAYQVILRFVSIEIDFSFVPFPLTGEPVRVPEVIVVKAGEDRNNDTAVAIDSGLGLGSMDDLLDRRLVIFFGPNGRNHISIANEGVADEVIPWILGVEKRHEHGDLR